MQASRSLHLPTSLELNPDQRAFFARLERDAIQRSVRPSTLDDLAAVAFLDRDFDARVEGFRCEQLDAAAASPPLVFCDSCLTSLVVDVVLILLEARAL